jgi:hypothetical protein
MKKHNAIILILLFTLSSCTKSFHVIQIDHKITIRVEQSTQEFIKTLATNKNETKIIKN